MARELWAKAYVNLPRHPNLIGRPDSDFRLWVGLFLHAKEYDAEGLVRLNPSEMKDAFAIKAPLAAVEKGLQHFISKGMLKKVEEGYRIRDFVDRQRIPKDTPEAHAARQARYRARVSGDGSAVPSPDPSRHRHGLSRSDADPDPEKDLEKEQKKEQEPARARVEDPWPARLLADLHRALGRKQLVTSDRPWQDFVTESSKYPIEIRQQAALEYIRRGATPGQHSPAYVLAMIRDGAGGGRSSGPTGWEIPGPEETTRRLEADLGPPPTPESRARLHAAYEATQLGKKRIRS